LILVVTSAQVAGVRIAQGFAGEGHYFSLQL
jgi:hypothetical protein